MLKNNIKLWNRKCLDNVDLIKKNIIRRTSDLDKLGEKNNFGG